MKIFGTVMKILTALAAVAGAIYVIATYGDKIVAWAKNLLSTYCYCDEDCCCGDCCCGEDCCGEEECCCGEECCCEEAAEEAEAEAEAAPEAEETDFEA